MNKYTFRLILALLATLLLSACGPTEEQKQKAADDAAAQAKLLAEQAALVLPRDATDKAAWQKYLIAQVTRFMRENPTLVKTNHPYMYYVPTGDGADQKSARNDQLENVKTTVGRGVLPGNLMAYGGPDSGLTADLIIEAFKEAQEGSLKGVVVLFVGAKADFDRVKEGVAKSGADYHYAELR
ncbi:MAG: hypothetical protein E6K53_10515 [Gammaproteobacteria bacterium]|nr:MAG: hypothetical protein E6K53_10515 [Gammaproteobacteria bacterium]